VRVINDDRVQPGQGVGTQSHRDLESISYVLEGALEHKDSLGNGSVIRPGDVQRMTAGTGVRHSEFNPSQAEVVHFLQIWIVPETAGLPPSYEERRFSPDDKRGRWRLIAARDGRDGAVLVHQDIDLYAALLDTDEALVHVPRPARRQWVQVARGAIELNGRALASGDGAAVAAEPEIRVRATAPSELLLFDMA
jgi:redox-sensitive bicupin YhaK (pirin superfamily)